jgi:hypothetical protein
LNHQLEGAMGDIRAALHGPRLQATNIFGEKGKRDLRKGLVRLTPKGICV